ncbi:structural protein [Cellulophaga phage phi12:2]|uniref:Structural protein n=1 Tax=Cellulophaga phage phi12:2 TaxID=1327969 RepID=R9ZZA0_9VIRU|nr:structural protein [Cellulophaga phage phi12:2]AGO47288.1 structural protein [Cellulophaga phage phi12:2]
MQAKLKNVTSQRNLVKIVKTSKKLPLTQQNIVLLRNNGIDCAALQRTFSRFYATRRVGQVLFLKSTILIQSTGKPHKEIRIDCSRWSFEHRVTVISNDSQNEFDFVVDGARDLCIKLFKHKLL